MDIILKKDVSNLGLKDDLVTVKNGYARNYLIPRGLAMIATGSARKVYEENKRQRAHKEEKLRNEAEEMVKKLAEIKLTIGAKTSSTGKIFGSVNNIQIAEELEKQGYTMDRKNIKIKDDSVKEVGTYTANVSLYRDINTDISFEVVSE